MPKKELDTTPEVFTEAETLEEKAPYSKSQLSKTEEIETEEEETGDWLTVPWSAPAAETMEPFVKPNGGVTELFLTLCEFNVPGGYEQDRFGQFLEENGWEKDEDGNARHEIFKPDGSRSKTGFCAHMDDVSHIVRRCNVQVENQIARSDGQSILGADDKAGMAILLHLIENGVPGVYHLFIKEESGMIGSQAAARRGWGEGLNTMIAFDRRGKESIITHQCGERTCSEAFAEQISEHAKNHGLNLKSDDTGSFTDSYAFASIIPECTNISVGYENAHSKSESQDLEYLETLARVISSFNWEEAKIERVAQKVPTRDEKRRWKKTSYQNSYYSRSSGTYEQGYHEEEETDGYPLYPEDYPVEEDVPNLENKNQHNNKRKTLIKMQKDKGLFGELARLARRVNGKISLYSWGPQRNDIDLRERLIEEIINEPRNAATLLVTMEENCQIPVDEIVMRFAPWTMEEMVARAIDINEWEEVAKAIPEAIAETILVAIREEENELWPLREMMSPEDLIESFEQAKAEAREGREENPFWER